MDATAAARPRTSQRRFQLGHQRRWMFPRRYRSAAGISSSTESLSLMPFPFTKPGERLLACVLVDVRRAKLRSRFSSIYVQAARKRLA